MLPKQTLKRIFLLLILVGGILRAETESAKGNSEWMGGILNTFGPNWIENKSPPKKEMNVFVDPDSLNTLRLPMCFFFDEQVEEPTANEKIRFLTKMYAACGIRIEAKTFTLRKGYPTDPTILTTLAKKACPFKESQGVRGAIQIETSLATVPQSMCQDPKARGCSTLCEPVSVSVVEMGSGNRVAFHESLHSNCCDPLCLEQGQGAGDAGGWDIEFSNRGTDAFENRLCNSLRKGASDLLISQWSLPLQDGVYKRAVTEADQIDLTASPVLLEPRQQPTLVGETKKFLTESTKIPARTPASLPPFIWRPTPESEAPRMPSGLPHKMGESLRKEKDNGFSIKNVYEGGDN